MLTADEIEVFYNESIISLIDLGSRSVDLANIGDKTFEEKNYNVDLIYALLSAIHGYDPNATGNCLTDQQVTDIIENVQVRIETGGAPHIESPTPPTPPSLLRNYWGDSALTTLNQTQIQALTNNPISSTVTGSYSFLAAGGEYKYLAFPDSYTPPVSIKLGAFDVAMAGVVEGYTLSANGIFYKIVSVTNDFGITVNYKLYRSLNQLGGAVIFVVN